MTLQASGTITMSQIQAEFGGQNPIGISEYFGAAAGIPVAGAVSMTTFYNKALPTSSTIANNVQNITLSNYINDGGTLTINAGVYVWSASTSAAITVDVNNATIINNGYIIGKGGDAGQGGANAGAAGSPAITNNANNLLIFNSTGAYIAGGGGGGGGGRNYNKPHEGGGGGGGAGGGNGAGGQVNASGGAGGPVGQYGNSGTAEAYMTPGTGGGAGGGGGGCFDFYESGGGGGGRILPGVGGDGGDRDVVADIGGYGGSAGNAGQAGQNRGGQNNGGGGGGGGWGAAGGNGDNGGVGGAGGKAINTTNTVYLSNNGTIYGDSTNAVTGFVLPISSNLSSSTPYDVSNAAFNSGWDGFQALILVVNEGVYVYSTDTAYAALNLNVTNMKLINNGYILGCGGSGGHGGDNFFTYQSAATNGGPALQVSVSGVQVINNPGAYIAGGGGGGYSNTGGGGGAGQQGAPGQKGSNGSYVTGIASCPADPPENGYYSGGSPGEGGDAGGGAGYANGSVNYNKCVGYTAFVGGGYGGRILPGTNPPNGAGIANNAGNGAGGGGWGASSSAAGGAAIIGTSRTVTGSGTIWGSV